MRVVYDIVTKQIEVISMSTVKDPTCQEICSHYVEGEDCVNCFVLPNNEEQALNFGKYLVDDTDLDDKVLIVADIYTVEWACEETEIAGEPIKTYRVAPGTTVAFTVKFLDKDGIPYKPTGTVDLRCQRGSLSQSSKVLVGEESEFTVNWVSVNETIDVPLGLLVPFWSPLRYNMPPHVKIQLRN